LELTGSRILYASTNHAWAAGWTFYQMLAAELARENDVVYVDTPASPLRPGGRDLRLLGGARAEHVGGGSLRVLRSAAVPAQRREGLRRAGAALTALQVGHWARREGFDPALVWVYTPYELTLSRRFPGSGLVYWTGDVVSIPGEDDLVAAAGAVLCVSEPVYERHRQRIGERAHFVGIACEFERYNRELDRPDDGGPLAGLRRPVAGYSGWLNERLDVGLVLDLAARLPEGTVVLAGPHDRLGAGARRALEAAPNVRLLGPQPADRVPALIRGFDLALIPYLDDAFNRGSNPVKFYEYLALGKPVVTTDVPTLRRFSDVASIGPGETFVERAMAALSSPDGRASARIEVARRHSFGALLERLKAIPL
jgi:glycosyltransferase involved in cell wall biosynthesis